MVQTLLSDWLVVEEDIAHEISAGITQLLEETEICVVFGGSKTIVFFRYELGLTFHNVIFCMDTEN